MVDATFQPTPFDPLLRGRRAIAEWFKSELERWPALTAQVLGVGDTYGVPTFESRPRAVSWMA